MPKVDLPPGRTDEDYVLGLLRATGVLCVYGSGFGMPAEDGFFRVVFLASPEELDEIYGLMARLHGAVLAQFEPRRNSVNCTACAAIRWPT